MRRQVELKRSIWGRRGLHNEGAQLLLERLKGKIENDQDTARRLFTLITALHWKG